MSSPYGAAVGLQLWLRDDDVVESPNLETGALLASKDIRSRCVSIGGGLRKSIRLCKNVKKDSERQITLPSFTLQPGCTTPTWSPFETPRSSN